MIGRIAFALGAAGTLLFAVGVWAATARLSSAVVAPGVVVVDGHVKKVQHPTGGIVGSILVKNGDRIRAGDVVMRLDDTLTRANLGIISSQLDQLRGRRARLEAERDASAELKFPAGYQDSSVDAAAIAAGERSLHASRRAALASQRAQLSERIGQVREEIIGLAAQILAKEKEIKLVAEELKRVEETHKRGYLPITRVTPLQREQARIEGERGTLIASSARAKAQINEIELQIIALDQTTRTEALRELREIDTRIAELVERRIAAEDSLRRIEIRAPSTGIVHELTVHTVGGVINAAEPVMVIVPSEDRLTIELRIAPPDIDQVVPGKEAMLRFPAFNQRTTPEVRGTVTRVAADLTRENQSGLAYFTARVRLNDGDVGKLQGMILLPGMPVEAFVQVGERSALSYLIKPLVDHFARAMREE